LPILRCAIKPRAHEALDHELIAARQLARGHSNCRAQTMKLCFAATPSCRD